MGALDRRLWRHARSTRGFLALTVVLGLAAAVLVIAQAALLATGIATVTAGSALPGRILVGLALVVVGRAAVAWAQESAAHRTAASVQAELRAGVFRAVAHRGHLDGEHAGAVTLLVTRGLDGLDAYFARYLPQVVLAVLVPVTMLVAVFPVDPVAATTMLVTVPLIPLFLALVGRTTRDRHRRHHQALERLSRHLLELVRGLPTLKTMGRAGAQVDTVRRLGEDQHRITMRTLRLAFVSSLVLELLATLSVALVAVAVGLRLVGGGLDLRTALFVLVLAPEVYLPLRQLGTQHHAAADGVAAATGAFAWLDAPTPPTGTRRPPAGPIRLDRISVRYPDRAAPALAGCDLRLDPGEVVALTGPSGCGKSTVLHALLGFVRPAGGRIEVGGTDLGEVDLAWWRTQVAWVPQRAHLFPGTVAQNIGLGDPVAPDDRVADAARAAGIEHLLTRVVDGGLSTGERQRVALARAFLRDAPVVLLDEPTANLDGAAEAALIESVRTLCRGRTVLLVAHRPALLALPDRVVDLTRAPEEVPA